MKQVYKDINKIIIDMGLEAPVKGEPWRSACHKILSALILNQKKLNKAIEQRNEVLSELAFECGGDLDEYYSRFRAELEAIK